MSKAAKGTKVRGSVITVKREDSGRPRKEKVRIKTRRTTRFAANTNLEEMREMAKNGLLEDDKIRIVHNKSEGPLMVFHVSTPRVVRNQIIVEAVYDFYNGKSKNGVETMQVPYKFPYERIFKCVPEGIEKGVGSYSVLIERAIAQRNIARTEVEKGLEQSLAFVPYRTNRELKCEKILGVLENSEFQKKLRTYVYFEVLFKVMMDAEYYRR